MNKKRLRQINDEMPITRIVLKSKANRDSGETSQSLIINADGLTHLTRRIDGVYTRKELIFSDTEIKEILRELAIYFNEVYKKKDSSSGTFKLEVEYDMCKFILTGPSISDVVSERLQTLVGEEAWLFNA